MPKLNSIFLFAALLIASSLHADEVALDSNVAFFEGEKYNYIMYPPDGFQLITDEVKSAGYSLAFVPEGQLYDSADITIDINIFRFKQKRSKVDFFSELIKDDTLQIRKHYGKTLVIRPVDSVFNKDGKLLPTFYFNDSTRFIPTVMMSYFDGANEVLIFELTIKRLQPKFVAEQKFTECLGKFRTLKSGDITERNKRMREKKTE
ncbi:MAG: hypothetical protein IIC66_11135 [candidate division Zixibacteria bacterium]|nr:hypothetical protein [candidate division Zixibacteria bacterium]